MAGHTVATGGPLREPQQHLAERSLVSGETGAGPCQRLREEGLSAVGALGDGEGAGRCRAQCRVSE